MIDDPRYAPVAGALPATLPPITRVDALAAYKALVRAFGSVTDMPVGVAEARGNRPIRSGRTRCRPVWAASKPTTGHHRGWGRIVHDAAHYVFECRHPHARPHDGGHATLEHQMAEYAAARLIPKAEARALKAKVANGRPTYGERIAHMSGLMLQWERKAKRAETAMRKLRRRIRALERAAKTATHVSK